MPARQELQQVVQERLCRLLLKKWQSGLAAALAVHERAALQESEASPAGVCLG